MAFTNGASLKAASDSPWQILSFSKNAITLVSGKLYSSWTMGTGDPPIGGTPGAAAACSSATTGALLNNGNVMKNSSGVARVVKFAASFAGAPTGAMIQLCDRISHMGGLSGITTGSIATSTTASTSRYSSGTKGILAAAEIYTAVGATADVIFMDSYTNYAGTAAQVGLSVVFGGTGANAAGRLISLPVASGDLGVETVESVSRTATTGTAGSWGVTTYMPLVTIPTYGMGPGLPEDEPAALGFLLPIIPASACLFFSIYANATTTGVLQGAVSLGEEA